MKTNVLEMQNVFESCVHEFTFISSQKKTNLISKMEFNENWFSENLNSSVSQMNLDLFLFVYILISCVTS